MKLRFQILTIAAVLIGFAACSDLKEFEDRLDSLESRVEAIESILPTLNDNIEALQKLAGGATINSVTEADGVYSVILTNGDTLKITQGSIGVGNAPIMSIDNEGYWMVDYGNGPEYLMDGEEKVRSESQTPKFSVDDQGCWLVSYDGETYVQVKDSKGNPVSALPESGDIFFKKAEVKGDTFVVTLADGTELILPIVPDFMFAIQREVTGLITLLYNEPVTFNIESKGVASVSVVACPSNVDVNITETSLTVEAVYNKTKAAADTRKDIAILAVSEKGFAAMAKLEVKIDENSRPSTTPRAFVNPVSSTLNTLKYQVKVKNTDTFKYIHQLTSEQQPSEEAFAQSMTIATDEWVEMTFDNLTIDTEYTLYVLPVLPSGQTLDPGEKISMSWTDGAKTKAPKPDATVNAASSTYKSITFAIDLNEESDSYEYRIYAEGETPSEAWTAVISPEAELEISDLKADQNYILEVVALNGEKYRSEIIETTGRTAIPVNNYEKFDGGMDIVVGNTIINKEKYPNAILLQNGEEITDLEADVYFIDGEVSYNTVDNITYSLAIIGNHFDKKDALTITPGKIDKLAIQFRLECREANSFILHNLAIKGSTDQNMITIVSSPGDYEQIIINNCDLDMPKLLYYMSHANYTIKNFLMEDCNYKAYGNVIQLGTASTTEYGTFIFKNNIFYSFYSPEDKGIAGFSLIANGTATPFRSIELTNNTFANVYSITKTGNGNPYLNVKSASNYTLKNNLFYLPLYDTEYGYETKDKEGNPVTDSRYSYILKVTPGSHDVENNVVHKTISTKRVRFAYIKGEDNKEADTYIDIKTKSEDVVYDVDLSSGTIIPAAGVTFGAKR